MSKIEKEVLITKVRSETVNLTDGKIDSFRENEETQKTVRFYQDGKISVAGALGDANIAELEKTAAAGLSGDGIPYVCKLSKNVKSVIKDKPAVQEDKFLPSAKRLAAKVKKACPKFLVNGKISVENVKKSYENSAGADLKFESSDFGASFVLKDRESSNIMDAGYGAAVRYYGKASEDKIVSDMANLHDAFFGKKVTLKDGDYPMIFSPFDIFGQVINDFVAEMYVSGGSLFSGKLGEKIFNENLSLYIDKNCSTNHTASFFDAEGEIAPDFRPKLIENGVLKGVLTTKNTAANFNLPLIKSTTASYDGVPSLGVSGLYLKPNSPDLKSLLGKKRAVLIEMTSGGDITPEGKLGLPVQLAFLVENGKIVSRVSDFQITADIFELLGKDFIGVSKSGVYSAQDSSVIVAKAKLING